MILVDPRMLEMSKASSSTPPIPDALGQSISALDQEIRDILHQTGIPQSQKVLMYQQLLQRYLTFADQYRDRGKGGGGRTDTERKKEAITTESIAESSPVTVAKSTEERVLNSVPKKLRRKAKLLLDHVKDASNMSWNSQDEIVIGGETLRGTNIKELINDVLRPRKHGESPYGWDRFQGALKASNIPSELILGRGEREKTDEETPQTPVMKISSTKRQSIRRRRRPKQWLEY